MDETQINKNHHRVQRQRWGRDLILKYIYWNNEGQVSLSMKIDWIIVLPIIGISLINYKSEKN